MADITDLWADGWRDVTVNPLNGQPSPPAALLAFPLPISIQRAIRTPRTPGDPPDDGGYMCGSGTMGTACDFLFAGRAGTDGSQLQSPKQKLRTTGGIPDGVPPPPPDQTGGP